ncbi:MAG: TatD family hydrolase [Bacteroides sp.]|jgi:TatD DNase family protein|nr:TatD family hydrolase [Bacteroides sp.]
MNLIDTHSHLFLEEFADDLPLVIDRARIAGVSHIFMPNIDSTTLSAMQSVCATYEGYCFPMVGLHPTSVNGDYLKELALVERELLHSFTEYVAIGEIGMDLYWDRSFLNEQLVVLDTQIRWALETDLPVVIHCREAFEFITGILEPYKNTSLRGIFHSFAGTVDEAKRLLEFQNFFIGINGIITFKNSHLSEVVHDIPLQRIVLETDSPYLAPVPHRGRRNESSYVKDVLIKVAEIYQESPEEVGEQTSKNALKVFGMLK